MKSINIYQYNFINKFITIIYIKELLISLVNKEYWEGKCIN
jgi:hypothetical protein